MDNAGSHSQRQQSVKLAIDCETGELVPADALLAMPEPEFTTLRRAAMAARRERRHGGDAVRYQCALCKHPLFLSRRIEGLQNRWFVHDGKSEHCPWYEGTRLTPDQVKALVYRGQQEGRPHREMKQFIATWLATDPLVSEVSQEQTTFSEVLKGEWRRPDVKCLYRGLPLVFEVQLSYTFLSDVIARDDFYRREGIFIIWVFARFDRNRAAVTDEAFFNRRNLFVLDADAREQSGERAVLTFNGYRQRPQVIADQVHDVWEAAFVSLAEVQFPLDTRWPYFFDYDAERRRVEAGRIEAWRAAERAAWSKGVEDYLAAALNYYRSDYADDDKAALLKVVDRLDANAGWHRGFEVLRNARFFGFHCVLPVLMSIRLDQPVGYKLASVYQVIEAGLRSGSRVGKHAFAVLYLWAYKVYQPTVAVKQRKWLRDYARELKRSVDDGEETYRRDTAFDEATALLFPEIEDDLATSFGTAH